VCEPPVDHDDLAERADQDVARLEIAMDHADRMRVRERVGDRDRDRKQRQPGTRVAGLVAEHVAEHAAGNEPHDVHPLAVREDAGLDQADDRRMGEPRDDPDLALEQGDMVRRGVEQALDGDDPSEAITRAQDAAHAATRDLVEKLVTTGLDLGQPARGHRDWSVHAACAVRICLRRGHALAA
jgi:hypothetical protein